MATISALRLPITTKVGFTFLEEAGAQDADASRATQFFLIVLFFFFFWQTSYLSLPDWHENGPNNRLYHDRHLSSRYVFYKNLYYLLILSFFLGLNAYKLWTTMAAGTEGKGT